MIAVAVLVGEVVHMIVDLEIVDLEIVLVGGVVHKIVVAAGIDHMSWVAAGMSLHEY